MMIGKTMSSIAVLPFLMNRMIRCPRAFGILAPGTQRERTARKSSGSTLRERQGKKRPFQNDSLHHSCTYCWQNEEAKLMNCAKQTAPIQGSLCSFVNG